MKSTKNPKNIIDYTAKSSYDLYHGFITNIVGNDNEIDIDFSYYNDNIDDNDSISTSLSIVRIILHPETSIKNTFYLEKDSLSLKFLDIEYFDKKYCIISLNFNDHSDSETFEIGAYSHIFVDLDTARKLWTFAITNGMIEVKAMKDTKK